MLFIALLWTNGTLISCARALTDLPAAVLGVAATLMPGAWLVPLCLLSAGALIKETSALSFAVLPGLNSGKTRGKQLILTGILMLAPLLLWLAYVQVMMGSSGSSGTNNFTWPLLGVIQKLNEAITILLSTSPAFPELFAYSVFEVICPLSLYVQALYLFRHPKPGVPAWRLGIGFAILLLVLASAVWAEQNAYSRVLLPLTMAFNLLIHQQEQGRSYLLWYVAGNVGMAAMLMKTAAILLLAIWL